VVLKSHSHALKAREVMTDDSESVALRPTVIDGQRQEDDYEVIWRGLPIGRIMKPPGDAHWWWGCNVYGQPQAANDRGPVINFKDCQLRFKIAWTRIRAGLTEEAISIAVRHAQTLAEQQSSNVDTQPKPEELRSLENNRAAPRQRVFKAGTIEFGGSTIDCVVRNIFGDRCGARGREPGEYSRRIQSSDLRQYRQTSMPGGLG